MVRWYSDDEQGIFIGFYVISAKISVSLQVNRITDLLAKQVLSLANGRRIDMLVVALTALLKSTPQRVQEALRLIKEHTDQCEHALLKMGPLQKL